MPDDSAQQAGIHRQIGVKRQIKAFCNFGMGALALCFAAIVQQSSIFIVETAQ